MLFDWMLSENPSIIIKKDSSEAKFIRCLIEGNYLECPNERRFLFDIVNNERNSIDVDKIDYIQRDCRCMNVPYISFNNQFLIKEMRVYDNEICYPEKYSMEVSKLFKSRYNLHHDCYNHKTIHAYELMVCDVLVAINKVVYDFEKVIYDPEQYLLLDDSIIDEVDCSESTEPGVLQAKEIIRRM